VTARLMSKAGAQDKDLEAWAAEVKAVLAVRVRRENAGQPAEPAPQIRPVWPINLVVLETVLGKALPIVRYRDATFPMRVLGEDPEADVRICVLEAAARRNPPALHLLREGAGDHSERVRWTANALIEQIVNRQGGPLPPYSEVK